MDYIKRQAQEDRKALKQLLQIEECHYVELDLGSFPNFHETGSVIGMKKNITGWMPFLFIVVIMCITSMKKHMKKHSCKRNDKQTDKHTMMKLVHIRTWYDDVARYLYDCFSYNEMSIDDIIEKWNNGLGENDSNEVEISHPDWNIHLSSNNKFAVSFDDDVVDIWEVK